MARRRRREAVLDAAAELVLLRVGERVREDGEQDDQVREPEAPVTARMRVFGVWLGGEDFSTQSARGVCKGRQEVDQSAGRSRAVKERHGNAVNIHDK